MTHEVIIGEDLLPIVDNGNLTVYRLVGLPDSPELSLALVKLSGENHQTVNSTTDAYYYVLSGVGYFTLWSGSYPETTVVRRGDVKKIPRGTPYKDVGSDLIMISMNHPAFDPNSSRILD